MYRTLAACVIALLLCAGAARDTGSLDIYFIDVEGGQSTLFVTPSRQSLLVDSGYGTNDDRDARRILAAAKDAHLDHIDEFLLTHFHGDHAGGFAAVAKQLPVRMVLDHGGFAPNAPASAISESTAAALKTYVDARAALLHREPRIGERLPLAGVDVTIVSSAGQTIRQPLHGAARRTAGCPPGAPAAEDAVENPRSTGLALRYGRFRFVDLGDLTGEPLYRLFCPADLLGRVDAYLLPHHGGDDVAWPALIGALAPRVAILNNGESKGSGVATFDMLHRADLKVRPYEGAVLQDVWQLHKSAKAGAHNFADARIANLDTTTGYWLKLRARRDGSFTITNPRTGETRRYRGPS